MMTITIPIEQMYTYLLGQSLQDVALIQSKWSQDIFGSDSIRGPIGPLKHLQKEVSEAIEAVNIMTDYHMLGAAQDTLKENLRMEFADIFLLWLDASRRAGFKIEEMMQAITQKQMINRHRIWPKSDGFDDVVEHVPG